ncbi:hypothetical protein L195_g053965 [Trifolium pratense]|uniref:Uncharacterized protein n=1 Tax=Trifolium pratense TaxID=57577 RepID=A0A2K3KDG1_TRIPR|nr:hypothetical protein L195_g053965 [Trifolium pratense]
MSETKMADWSATNQLVMSWLRLRLMPSLGGEHPSKKQKSEEVQKEKANKPSDGPKLDSVRAPARGSKVECPPSCFIRSISASSSPSCL